MKEPIKLSPFKHLCMTIGNLPSSYVDSMSYYECLLWLINYLQKTVIPAVDNNAEAVKEIQDWINNLDLQDEVNNKLDEMTESGELQEIISEYLNSQAIFGYDTVSDMKSATNLINGSFARTLGYYSKNDGGSGLYKIRTITNDDVVDEGFIISLDDDTLVAELIVTDTISAKQYGAYGDNTHDDTTKLQALVSKANELDVKAYINAGTYKVTDTINIPFNTIIEGENMRESVIMSTITDSGYTFINGNEYDYQKRDTRIKNLYIDSTNHSKGIYTYSSIELENVYMIRLGRAFEKDYGYMDFIRLTNVYANYCAPSDNNGVIYLQGDSDGYSLNQVGCSNNDLTKFGLVVYRSKNFSINNSILNSPVYIKESSAVLNNIHMENKENYVKVENSIVTMNNCYKWKRLDGEDFVLTGSYNQRNHLQLNDLSLDYYPTSAEYVSSPTNIFSYDDYSDIGFNNIDYHFSTRKIDNNVNQHFPFALPFTNDNPINYIDCKSIRENGFTWKKRTHGGSVYFTNFGTMPFKGESGNYDIIIYISPVRTTGVCDYKITVTDRQINAPLYMQIQRNQCGFAHIYYKKHSDVNYSKYCIVPLTTPTIYFDGVAFNGITPTDVTYDDSTSWTTIDGVVSATYRTFSSDNTPPTVGTYINGDMWLDNGVPYVRKGNNWVAITTAS